MTRTLTEFLDEHPVDEGEVDIAKTRMRAEMRAYQLRELREHAHLTQVELAFTLGLSQHRISNIEHGDIERTQVDTLRRYVEAVGGRLRVEVELGDHRFQIA